MIGTGRAARRARHDPERNSTAADLAALAAAVASAGLVPLLTGDAVADVPPGAVDLTLFWRDPVFGGPDQRRAQLQLFEHLRSAHGLVGQVGVTTAGMDGPALMGLPTAYLTRAPNVRLRAWVGAVPGYRELIQDDDLLARVAATCASYA